MSKKPYKPKTIKPSLDHTTGMAISRFVQLYYLHTMAALKATYAASDEQALRFVQGIDEQVKGQLFKEAANIGAMAEAAKNGDNEQSNLD